jgi:hypothetical protein
MYRNLEAIGMRSLGLFVPRVEAARTPGLVEVHPPAAAVPDQHSPVDHPGQRRSRGSARPVLPAQICQQYVDPEWPEKVRFAGSQGIEKMMRRSHKRRMSFGGRESMVFASTDVFIPAGTRGYDPRCPGDQYEELGGIRWSMHHHCSSTALRVSPPAFSIPAFLVAAH